MGLTADGKVAQRPARELLALRGPRVLHGTGHATRHEPIEIGQVGHTFDLTAVLVPDTTGTSGLRLIASTDGAEYLDVSLDPTAGRLVVDRTHASPDARARGGAYTAPCPTAKRPNTPVELRVIVDRSIAEVYLAEEQVLTLRFYPVHRRTVAATGPYDRARAQRVRRRGLEPGPAGHPEGVPQARWAAER
ncbi:hypothetical protein SGLAM104S_08290 [Streptomyces glaucescens]